MRKCFLFINKYNLIFKSNKGKVVKIKICLRKELKVRVDLGIWVLNFSFCFL